MFTAEYRFPRLYLRQPFSGAGSHCALSCFSLRGEPLRGASVPLTSCTCCPLPKITTTWPEWSPSCHGLTRASLKAGVFSLKGGVHSLRFFTWEGALWPCSPLEHQPGDANLAFGCPQPFVFAVLFWVPSTLLRQPFKPVYANGSCHCNYVT